MQLEFDFDEQWKPIEGYEGRYDISTKGKLYSYSRNTKKDYNYGNLTTYGYLEYVLLKDKIKKYVRMHRLVWETFVGKIPKGYVIHHKNHIKTDNRLENLELVKQSDHARQHLLEHQEKTLKAIKDEDYNKIRKKVIQYTKNNQFVTEYESAAEASRQTGIDGGSISRCCNDKQKQAGGFIWKFKEKKVA